jgi:DnaJ-class molecular chaperone
MLKECDKCKGKGYVTVRNNARDVISDFLLYERKCCDACNGKGFIG